MAGVAFIRPLSNSQKLFLQRLTVAHVLTDSQAKDLYATIREKFANVQPDGEDDIDPCYMGNNFEHCLGIINSSLLPAFDLEICTVSLPPIYDPDNPRALQSPNDDDGDNSQNSRRRSKNNATNRLVKYHAVVNRSNDTIAQQSGSPLCHGGPHELAYFRLVFEKLVERGLENESASASVGCSGVMSRMELINLRTELGGPHKDKLTISQTEVALEMLEREGWIVVGAPPEEDDESVPDGEDDEGGGVQSSKIRRKRKSAKRSYSDGNRRKSLKGTFYGVGPRSFMELGDFLQGLGFPEEKMPQSILHRV